MRFAAIALLFVALACSPAPEVTAPTASPTPVPTPTPTPEGYGRTDLDRMMSHVRALAVDVGQREAGSEGDRLAATYLIDQLRGLGLDASEQTFALPQGGTSSNVIGRPQGFDPSDGYLIVGGHRDSLAGPGANDNATGVAIALDMARALDEVPAAVPVVFVAFGAEERQPAPNRPHHVGSASYVAGMSEQERGRLIAFINLDMVGHGDTIVCGTLSTGPREGTERCVDRAGALGIAAEARVLPDWSDHGSFQKAGMNTAWLWTGELDCCYHNPKDTIDVVRPADVERVARLAMAIVRSYEPIASSS